jgi:hypothetical protein
VGLKGISRQESRRYDSIVQGYLPDRYLGKPKGFKSFQNQGHEAKECITWLTGLSKRKANRHEKDASYKKSLYPGSMHKLEGVMKTNEPTRCQLVVGASALDVAGLLAVVTNPLTLGLCGAVARDMADFAAFLHVNMNMEKAREPLTVVALLAVSAVAGHVAETAARVASLLAATEATATTTSSETTSIATTLGAVSGNVTDAATLVALLAASWAVVFTGLRAFAGDVTDTTATVARLLLGGYSAFTA